MSRWPRNKAYFWEIAPFFRILLPFAAGILCYYEAWLSAVPTNVFWVVAVLSFVFLGILIIARSAMGVTTTLTFFLINISLFCCGASISAYHDIRNDPTWFGRNIEPTAAYLARINATPDEKEHSWKLSVTVLNKMDATSVTTVTGKAFVYVQKDSLLFTLHRGDTLLVPGKWQPIKDAGNPFEFSYATYCAHNNLYHAQWCTSINARLLGASSAATLPLTERTHDWCMGQLASYLGSHKAMGLLQAMLLGDEVNLDENLRQSYSETGIIHIIAISGGNVSIFFMVIAFLLGWIRHKKYHWIKYALALPVIWFYVLMAGAQPSAMRAAVLFSLLAVGVMFQKNNNGINHLFATVFLLLVADPAWLFSVGFQLSFVAVLSIMLFYKPIYNLLPLKQAKGSGIVFWWQLQLRLIIKNLWGAVTMSIAAEILVAPLVIYYFHTFPVMFIIANVAAFLFMGVVLVLGMLLITVSALPGLASYVATLIMWLVAVFGSFLTHLQGVGPEAFNSLLLPGTAILLLYTAIAGVASFALLQNKRALIGGLTAACLLLLSLCISEWHSLHQRRFVVYNTKGCLHAELLQDGYYSVLQTDTTAAKQVLYATRPAHIGFRTCKEKAEPNNEIRSIGSKTVLILNQQLKGAVPFHVDYLVLNDSDKIDVPALLKVFTPAMLVVGNNYSKKEQINITDNCKKAKVAVHITALKGAFMLSD